MNDDALARAGRLLAGNTKSGFLDDRRLVFTVPSLERYPFQWFWDSCFHAIVWARIDVGRAIEELRALLAVQAESGLIPHVVFWDATRAPRFGWPYLESTGRLGLTDPGRRPRVSAMIQPPVIAQAVEAVVAAGGGSFLDEALPALERYYRFLARERDPNRNGLISIIAQFESGLDYSPAYDSPRRPPRSATAIHLRARLPQLVNKLVDYDPDRVFRFNRRHVEDVLVNSVYADGLQALARLAAEAGEPELQLWATALAETVLERLLERSYDERRGLFFNLNGPRERRDNLVKTIGCLLPLLLADLPEAVAARLLEHLTDPSEFWAPFPVPSVALDEPRFRPDGRVGGERLTWRGPTSLNTNWLLARGLRRHGQAGLADEIAERSRRLVDSGGFNEFYNPLDGRPVGTERFGWATLAADF
jgi:hypothetical protein